MLADGSHWYSLFNRIWRHCWNCSSVGHRLVNMQVTPFIPIGMKSSSISMTRDQYPSAGLPHTGIPQDLHWLGFINHLSMQFSNHKPFPKTKITVSPISKVYAVSEENIRIIICSGYSSKNGDTVHCRFVKMIGRKLLPKQWVSPWLIISVWQPSHNIFYSL